MRAFCFLLILLSSACQADETSPTAEEDRQLNETEQLLNEAPESLERIDDQGLATVNNAF